MIRALILSVGAAPAAMFLHDDADVAWRSLRHLVGGYVQQVHLTGPDADGYRLTAHVNEEGIPLGLPFNRAFLYPRGAIQLFGPIVVLAERVDGEGWSSYRDITAEDEGRLADMLVAVEAAVAS